MRRDAARNRELILEAARRLVARDGLLVAYDEIARAAGIGVGTVYRRFPEREDLILELFDRRVADLADEGDAALGADDAWEGLRTFMERVIEVQIEDRGFSEVLMNGAAYGEGVATCGDRLRPRLGALVDRARSSGKLAADVELEDFVVILTALTWMSHHEAPDAWRRCAGVFYAGLTRK